MKKKSVVLISFIMILTMGFSVSAAEKQNNQIEKALIEHTYSGDRADFNIVISQNISSESSARNASGTSATVETTRWGVKEKIVLTDKMNNQNIMVKFTDNNGDRIKMEEDDSVLLFNNNNKMIGAASNLSLKDANGNEVNASAKKLNNNTIYYSIDDKNAVYPLFAEIDLYGVDDFSQWFSGGLWIDRGGDISLSLTHTGWAYTGCPTGLITWSWNTVVNKFSSTKHWTNEQGMADQYQCHVNFATTKNPWNLEPWRPNVGISATIQAKCNP